MTGRKVRMANICLVASKVGLWGCGYESLSLGVRELREGARVSFLIEGIEWRKIRTGMRYFKCVYRGTPSSMYFQGRVLVVLL